MKKSKYNEYKIRLGQVENNGLHLIAAQLDMDFNQVITLALNDYIRKQLKTSIFNGLDDDRHVQHLIGETINVNRGIWGYSPDMNDIPDDKKHLLIESCYGEEML